MATADNRSAFEISDIAIPAKDTRDEAIKRLDAKCRVICNLANDVRDASHELSEMERGKADVRALIVPVGFKRPFICFNKGVHGGCRMGGKNNGQCPFSSEGAMRLCYHFVELRRKENIAKIN